METQLYKQIMSIFYEEKCSKREFAEKHNLSHFWFTDFTKKDSKRRVLRPKTISILFTELGITPDVCEEYNEYVLNLENGK